MFKGDHWEDEAYIKECKASYAEIVAVNFDSKKIGLNKGNLIKMAFAYWYRNFQGLRMTLLSVLVHMMQSELYIPSANILSSAHGGVCRKQAEAMWTVVCFPHAVTKRALRNVFFSDVRGETHIGFVLDWCAPNCDAPNPNPGAASDSEGECPFNTVEEGREAAAALRNGAPHQDSPSQSAEELDDQFDHFLDIETSPEPYEARNMTSKRTRAEVEQEQQDEELARALEDEDETGYQYQRSVPENHARGYESPARMTGHATAYESPEPNIGDMLTEMKGMDHSPRDFV